MPLPNDTHPLFPLFALPELKTSRPLGPAVPPFAVLIDTIPLDVAVPSPVMYVIAPPVIPTLRPAETKMQELAPDVPLPLVMQTAPPRPPVAIPDPTDIPPLLPEHVEPELNTSNPLPPEVPLLLVNRLILPLLVAVPSPDTI
mmetsp:Transcript_5529/g.7093  ORF Transcript_5529/g.7093 Transcript_5529/m.7093 type:complete len:143 (+) Transcript_5529:918-1346(+)